MPWCFSEVENVQHDIRVNKQFFIICSFVVGFVGIFASLSLCACTYEILAFANNANDFYRTSVLNVTTKAHFNVTTI